MISVTVPSEDSETYRAYLKAQTACTNVGSYFRSPRVELMTMVFTVR